MSANKLIDNFHSNSRFPFSFFNSILIFVLFPSIILWLLEFPYAVLGVYLYIASLIFIVHNNWRINHYSFFLAGYAFFLCSFLVFQGYYLLAINFFTAFGGLIYAFSLNVRQLRGLFKFIHIYTFLIITSIFGMFWVFLGLEDFGTFNNPNGDPQYVIPFTFFGVEEFFIRPSSLYFEPGYFAFFIITFLYCRLLLGINTSFDKYIAFAGLITQSFTYIACLGLYFLVTRYLNKNKDSLSFLFIVIPFTFLVLFSQSFDWIFIRVLGWYENPESAVRIVDLLELILILSDPKTLIFGLDSCNNGNPECPLIVGNLFAPFIRGGLISYFPIFFIFIQLLFLLIFERKLLPLVGLLILLILMNSKPIYLLFPYSIVVGLFFSCILYNLKDKKND